MKTMADIDETQPVCAQLYKLSPEEYVEWTYKPSKYRTFQLFQNSFLEMCSKSSFASSMVIWTMLSCSSYMWLGPSAYEVAVGWTIWTGLEYTIHRFIYHGAFHRNNIGRMLHFIIHGCHHRYPNDHERLSSAFINIPSLVLIYKMLAHFQLGSLLPGIIIGASVYDAIHFSHHQGYSYKLPWISSLAKLHMKHHYINPNTNLGVSTFIWDRVFGTIKEQ